MIGSQNWATAPNALSPGAQAVPALSLGGPGSGTWGRWCDGMSHCERLDLHPCVELFVPASQPGPPLEHSTSPTAVVGSIDGPRKGPSIEARERCGHREQPGKTQAERGPSQMRWPPVPSASVRKVVANAAAVPLPDCRRDAAPLAIQADVARVVHPAASCGVRPAVSRTGRLQHGLYRGARFSDLGGSP